MLLVVGGVGDVVALLGLLGGRLLLRLLRLETLVHDVQPRLFHTHRLSTHLRLDIFVLSHALFVVSRKIDYGRLLLSTRKEISGSLLIAHSIVMALPDGVLRVDLLQNARFAQSSVLVAAVSVDHVPIVNPALWSLRGSHVVLHKHVLFL